MLDFRKNKWINELRTIQAPVAGFLPWHVLVMCFVSMAKRQKWDIPSIFIFFAIIPLHMCMGIKVIWRMTQCSDTILRLCRAQKRTELFFKWDCTSLMFAQQPAQWGWDSSQALLAFHCLFHVHFYLAPRKWNNKEFSITSHIRWHKKPLEVLILENMLKQLHIKNGNSSRNRARQQLGEKEQSEGVPGQIFPSYLHMYVI